MYKKNIHSPATITNMLFPVWKSCAVIPTIKLQKNTLCCREKKHLIVTTTVLNGGCGGSLWRYNKYKCLKSIWMKFSVVKKKKDSTMIYLKYIISDKNVFWLHFGYKTFYSFKLFFIISWNYYPSFTYLKINPSLINVVLVYVKFNCNFSIKGIRNQAKTT